MKFRIYTIFLLLFSSEIFAQQSSKITPDYYPQGYFLFPINPGQQNFLAGGMGEMRPDHFHAGLDIKTQGKENLPVLASAEGYIWKVAVMTHGYGNVIFIKHPNGFTTVYGHLKEFSEPLASFVKQKRLETHTFEIKLDLEPNQFPVARGQTIAMSGNTGGSVGPHLHFEIRDKFENLMNPLLFGFIEIIDNLPPIFKQITIVPLSINTRIDGEFARKTFYAKQQPDGKFLIPQTISIFGEIGIEMDAVDKMNYTHNTSGISCTEVFVNDEEVFYNSLNTFPNNLQHDFNVFEDYANEQQKNQRIQKLFIEDGNRLPIYRSKSAGKILIEEGKSYALKIKVYDHKENANELVFSVLGQKPSNTTIASTSPQPTEIQSFLENNVLGIKVKNLKSVNSLLEITLSDGKKQLISISYSKGNESFYLWDLRKGLPILATIDGAVLDFAFRKTIFPNQESSFESKNLRVEFSMESLYDTLFFETSVNKNILNIGSSSVPLKGKINVKFSLSDSIPLKEKTSFYRIKNLERDFLKSTWTDKSVSFSTEKFGIFEMLTDSIPPTLKFLEANKDYALLSMKDELSGIEHFKGFLNDKPVLLDYDYKSSKIWLIKPDLNQPLLGKLKIEVFDNQGNKGFFEKDLIESIPVIHTPKTKKMPKRR
jgi:Peptidase family M23